MNNWRRASDWGICVSGTPDDDAAAYNAGHLNDILRLDETPFSTILVASDTSGVWLVNQAGGLALELSNTWAQPNLRSLARGVRGTRHVYAAGDALFETDVTQLAAILSWNQIPVVDSSGNTINHGGINDAVALGRARKLVLACGNGIFWAEIPAAGSSYAFTKVPRMPTVGYSAVTEGPGSTVVAAAWGDASRNHFGIFFGDWSTGALVLQRSTLLGNVNPKMMLRTSLDSCRANRSVIYAVAGANYLDNQGNVVQDTIYRVLRSLDGGQTWRLTGRHVNNQSDSLFGNPATNLPGNQQGYNNCIGVSPTMSNVVAIGWRNGYFLSTNAGQDWDFISADSSPHLHEDFHAVAFDQFDAMQQTLYICSDGGLAVTTDRGGTHSTLTNRQLPNLQFTRLAASYQVSGLLAGSLQDNGDQFAQLYPNAYPWRILDEGDGSAVAFVRNGHLLRFNNTLTINNVEFGNRVREAEWKPSTSQAASTFKDKQYFSTSPLNRGVVPIDGTSDGLPFPVLEIVNNPTWKNNRGELLVALGGKDDTVYGLFLKGGPGLGWRRLAKLALSPNKAGKRTESISAVGSSDGKTVWAGTDKGRIFKLSAPGWASRNMTPAGNTGQINRFVVQSTAVAFCIASGRQLFRLRAGAWGLVAGPPGASGEFTSLESDWTASPRTLFVSTDTNVFANDGSTWTDISAGLPKTPHCRDLRFVTEESGTHFLYLATYGRSIYRLLLNASEERIVRVTINGRMDMVDRVAFGHDIWAHPNFANTVTLGPLHPIEDISIEEDDGDEIQVKLELHLQWFTDPSVRIDYKATLISKDEDNAVADQHTGSFKLPMGGTHNVVEDLKSDEYWPDRAHIEFTATW